MTKTKTTLEKNKEYKIVQSRLKLEKKVALKIQKRQLYYDKLRATALQKSQGAINTKYNKKISSFTKKTIKESQKKIKNIEREIKGYKIVNYKVKKKSWSKLFEVLLTLKQKYTKLVHSDEN